MEELLIALFDTTNPELGYNLASGGKNFRHSEETKKKISDSKKGTHYPESHREAARKLHSKPVYCVELDRVFESAKIASEELKISVDGVRRCCNGKNKTCGSYHFIYKEAI